MKGQRSYEAVKITKIYGMVNLHGCSSVKIIDLYIFSLNDLFTEGFLYIRMIEQEVQVNTNILELFS